VTGNILEGEYQEEGRRGRGGEGWGEDQSSLVYDGAVRQEVSGRLLRPCAVRACIVRYPGAPGRALARAARGIRAYRDGTPLSGLWLLVKISQASKA